MSEKISKIILEAKKDSSWSTQVSWRRANKYWLDTSSVIALKVLDALEEKNMTKEDLANALGWWPGMVNMLVKGNVDLTLSKMRQLEDVLGIKIFDNTDKP